MIEVIATVSFLGLIIVFNIFVLSPMLRGALGEKR